MNALMLNDIFFIKDQRVFILLARTSFRSMCRKVLKSRETTLHKISDDAVSHIGGMGDNLSLFVHVLPTLEL